MKKLISLMIIMSFVFLSVSLVSATDIPMMLNYQGYVEDSSGVPVDGPGYFKFAIVDPNGSTTYWSNDGTSTIGDDPNSAVKIPVTKGFFTIKLGDTGLTHMTSTLEDSVFAPQDIYVRVWFSIDEYGPFEQLRPDTQIVSSGFAYKAQSVVSGHSLDAADGDPVDAVYVDNEGNVGIGITGPPYSLQVAPVGATGAGLGIGWNKIFGRGETDFYNYGQLGSGGFSFWNYRAPGASYPTTGETHLMSITSTGNVGIGTTNPEAILDIVTSDRYMHVYKWSMYPLNFGYGGSDKARIRVQQEDLGFHGGENFMQLLTVSPNGTAVANITMYSDGVTTFRAGNVGIGTSSPETKLDVEGTVQAHAFDTGDIVFRKDGEKLWRMFEDEKGLCLESLKTGEISRIFLEKDVKALEARLAKIEALLKVGQ